MSASPVLFNPTPFKRPANLRAHWLPALCAILFICFTSTSFMGGSHTQILVNAVWKALFGTSHWNLTGPVNEYSRKAGHFIGYGLVSLIFRNAWQKSAQAFSWVGRSWLPLFAAMLAVASTFTVACLDEFHQTFLPGRVGCFSDALIDATGAIVLNAIFWFMRLRNRPSLTIGPQHSARPRHSALRVSL